MRGHPFLPRTPSEGVSLPAKREGKHSYFVLALRLTSAAPAAVFEALPVLPLRKTLLAAVAAFADVRIVLFFAICFSSFPQEYAERESRAGQRSTGL